MLERFFRWGDSDRRTFAGALGGIQLHEAPCSQGDCIGEVSGVRRECSVLCMTNTRTATVGLTGVVAKKLKRRVMLGRCEVPYTISRALFAHVGFRCLRWSPAWAIRAVATAHRTSVHSSSWSPRSLRMWARRTCTLTRTRGIPGQGVDAAADFNACFFLKKMLSRPRDA